MSISCSSSRSQVKKISLDLIRLETYVIASLLSLFKLIITGRSLKWWKFCAFPRQIKSKTARFPLNKDPLTEDHIKELTPLNKEDLEIRPSRVLQLTKDSSHSFYLSLVLLMSYFTTVGMDWSNLNCESSNKQIKFYDSSHSWLTNDSNRLPQLSERPAV